MTSAATPTGPWLRQFAVLCVHALLFQAATFLARPTASYRAIELDVPTALLGLLVASFAFVPLLVAMPAGDLADRYGESRVMLTGTLVIAGAMTLFVVAGDTFGMLLLGTLLLGTGHLMCAVGQHAMVANLVPSGRLDDAFGYYTFAGSVGQAAGPALLGLIGSGAALPPSHDVFVVCLGISIVLVVVTTLARRTTQTGVAPRADRTVAALLRTPGLPRALVVSSVVLAAMDITLVYLPALGAEHGLSVGAVSGLLTARAVATMVARLFTGALTARLGRRLLMVLSIGASGVATALVPLPVPLALTGVAIVVMGFGLGVCQPATLAWLAEIAPVGARGRVMSLRLVGNRFGQVVLPTGIGLVAAGLGAAGVLGLTGASLVAAAGIARSAPLDSAGDLGG
ncbi:MFS transporter [Nocardioides sp.]|uniref:MFS transporter n=1 Tax=Nocardioides sp. TaxID=35761 RepID=UPI002ED0FE01